MGYQYKGNKTGERDPWVNPPRREQNRHPSPSTAVAECGTKSGHKRHIRKGEKPCEPCKAAKREYDRLWRKGLTGVAA